MSWLTELRTTALVGTARHPAPAPPQELGAQPPEGRSSEESLLDQAAMADAVVRATRRAGHLAPGTVRDPAPPDDAPPASGDAARLLDLLLTQSPVGRELQFRLVTDWLVLAERAELRVPHGLLPALLTLAGGAPSVAEHLEPAIGTRGRWLQDLSSQPAAGQGSPADAEWAELGGTDASAQLARLRERDPASARELLTAAWEGLGARERAAHLAVLATNLGPADEDLLETALDDKAKGVREAATPLLDRLPQSARATRMAARLRPLLRVKGLLRKQFVIDLPADPDAAAVRDGVAPSPRAGEPDRLQWLDTIIRGAPLDVWTAAAGGTPESALALLAGDARVIATILSTAALRADLDWVRALLELRTDLRLVACLPPHERELALRRELRNGSTPPIELVPLLRKLPTPWGLPLAEEVLELIATKKGSLVASALAPTLPMAIPPEATEQCRRLLERTDGDAGRRRVLRDIVQYQSFRRSITEAFA